MKMIKNWNQHGRLNQGRMLMSWKDSNRNNNQSFCCDWSSEEISRRKEGFACKCLVGQESRWEGGFAELWIYVGSFDEERILLAQISCEANVQGPGWNPAPAILLGKSKNKFSYLMFISMKMFTMTMTMTMTIYQTLGNHHFHTKPYPADFPWPGVISRFDTPENVLFAQWNPLRC